MPGWRGATVLRRVLRPGPAIKRTMATMARTTLARITRMTITGRDIPRRTLQREAGKGEARQMSGKTTPEALRLRVYIFVSTGSQALAQNPQVQVRYLGQPVSS